MSIRLCQSELSFRGLNSTTGIRAVALQHFVLQLHSISEVEVFLSSDCSVPMDSSPSGKVIRGSIVSEVHIFNLQKYVYSGMIEDYWYPDTPCRNIRNFGIM